MSHPFLLGSFLDLSLAPIHPFPAPEIPSRAPPAVFQAQRRPIQLEFELFLAAELESIQEQAARQQVSLAPPIPGLRFGRIRPNFIVFCSPAALFFSPSCRKVGSIASPARLFLRSGGERKRHKRDKRRVLDAVLVVAATATPLLVAPPAVYPLGAAGAPAAAARFSAGAC